MWTTNEDFGYSVQQATRESNSKPLLRRFAMVGKTGFEPATPCSQSRCATKLRHFPFGLTGYPDCGKPGPVSLSTYISTAMACVGQLSSAMRHSASISLPGAAFSSFANPSSPTSNTSGAFISHEPLPMHLSTSRTTRTHISSK